MESCALINLTGLPTYKPLSFKFFITTAPAPNLLFSFILILSIIVLFIPKIQHCPIHYEKVVFFEKPAIATLGDKKEWAPTILWCATRDPILIKTLASIST